MALETKLFIIALSIMSPAIYFVACVLLVIRLLTNVDQTINPLDRTLGGGVASVFRFRFNNECCFQLHLTQHISEVE